MCRLTLPRGAILTRASEFQRTFRNRRVISDRYFRVFTISGEQPRLGMVVGRRVSPKAVVRNRIRRLIRESFRRARPRLPAMDFVVQARGLAATAEKRHLNSSLDEFWQRICDRAGGCSTE